MSQLSSFVSLVNWTRPRAMSSRKLPRKVCCRIHFLDLHGHQSAKQHRQSKPNFVACLRWQSMREQRVVTEELHWQRGAPMITTSLCCQLVQGGTWAEKRKRWRSSGARETVSVRQYRIKVSNTLCAHELEAYRKLQKERGLFDGTLNMDGERLEWSRRGTWSS